MLTAIPGSSAYFSGGVITYSNAVKHSLLGVSNQALEEYGAVSPVVAEQMAQGVRQRLGTDWALSITGIAGPDGGSDRKPVGLVYIGLAGDQGVRHLECRFGKGREWVRLMSRNTALDFLRRVLLDT